MNQFLFRILALFLLLASVESCSPVLKPYERQYVSDPEMSMTGGNANKFQHYIHAIREGAIAAEGKKGSGGCGCN